MQIELNIDKSEHRAAARAMLDALDGRAPGRVDHIGAHRPGYTEVVTDRDVRPGDPVYTASDAQQTPPPPPPPAADQPGPSSTSVDDQQAPDPEPHQGQALPGKFAAEFPEGCDPNDLDDAGTPYYIEIHTGTRSKNADGTWRYKRGLKDRAEAERIEAELRELVRATKEPEPEAGAAEPLFGRTSYPGSVFGDGSGSQTPPPPPPPAASKNAEPATAAPSAAAPSNDTPPPPPPPPAQTNAGPVSFATIMRRIGKDRPSDQAVTDALAAEGVQSLAMLGTQPDKIPAVYARIFPNG